MKFINITNRVVNTTMSGTLAPGRSSFDGGKSRQRLAEAIEEVIKACGSNLAIRLNEKEVALIDKLMKLDETGINFNPSSIPESIRNDPSGEKRANRAISEAQQRALDRDKAANAKKAEREAFINGETYTSVRKPVGLATMEGAKVTPESLKSGFDAILAENARIADEKKPYNPSEILDPVGAHMKKDEVVPDIPDVLGAPVDYTQDIPDVPDTPADDAQDEPRGQEAPAEDKPSKADAGEAAKTSRSKTRKTRKTK